LSKKSSNFFLLGNGKTIIAKAVAARLAETNEQRKDMKFIHTKMANLLEVIQEQEDESKNHPSPFFKVTAANFKSKWSGQTEITLTAMFKIAQLNGPAVLFIDEVENLFASRSDPSGKDSAGDGIVQLFLDLTTNNPKVIFIGATNYPWLIDEALHRRLLPTYIRMPTRDERLELLMKLFREGDHFLTKSTLEYIADETEGYSFDDVTTLREDALKFSRKVARESTYFKLTPKVEGYEETWTPCMEDEKGAKRKQYKQLLSTSRGVAFPTITKEMLEHCLAKKLPSVSKETIEKNDLFHEKGKTAVEEKMRAKYKKNKENS